jgi:hypothetical protein
MVQARSREYIGRVMQNPNSDSLQEEIAVRAHSIWEREGRPEGQDTDHWLRAERELADRNGDSRKMESIGRGSTEQRSPQKKRLVERPS